MTKQIPRAKKTKLKILANSGGVAGNTTLTLTKYKKALTVVVVNTTPQNQQNILADGDGVAVHITAYNYKIQKTLPIVVVKTRAKNQQKILANNGQLVG